MTLLMERKTDMDEIFIGRMIRVLELELDTDLDDKEWENICDEKLDLLIILREIKKGMHEPH